MPNDKSPPKQKTLTQQETSGDCVSRLVRYSLTLDEFIFEQLKSLEDFESSWKELHRKNDEIYPLEMFAGDWSEQLAFWREREDLILPNANMEAPNA
jgi:hypothetical protein